MSDDPVYAHITHPTITIPAEHPWEGTYLMELGTIDYTHIGFEDHGIFSWAIGFKFSGSGQGTGHYTFTEEMLDVTKRVLNTVGGAQWEFLPKKRVYVIRRERYDRIIGLANVDDPATKWMFFPE